MGKIPFCTYMAAMLLPLAACDGPSDDIAKVEVTETNELKDGKPITQTPTDPGKFTEIVTIGPDDVILKTGDRFSISAKGNEDSLQYLRFILSDGKLTVGRYKSSWSLSDRDKAIITITAPSVSTIALVGSGDVRAELVNGENGVLRLAGSGDLIVADITTPQLKADLAGSGNMTLAGKVADAAYSVAGSGNIEATKLASSSASASIAGSGDINLSASGRVDANIAGSGNIGVSGGAKCTSSVVGTGKLNCP
jgi:Putative auto-transporter adhesin, head GIN domain